MSGESFDDYHGTPHWDTATGLDAGSMTLAVRSSLDMAAVGAILNRELRHVQPGFQLDDLTTLDRHVEDTVLRERLLPELSAFFGVG